jgi:hypothetical protein
VKEDKNANISYIVGNISENAGYLSMRGRIKMDEKKK